MTAHLRIAGPIGPAGDVIASIADIADLRITVQIDSPGGAFWDGLAIYRALREHPAEVTTLISGRAGGVAALVAMAGDRCLIAPRGSIQTSPCEDYGSGYVPAGTPHALDEMAAEVFRDRAGSREDWLQRVRVVTTYTAEQALEAGLVDEIVPA